MKRMPGVKRSKAKPQRRWNGNLTSRGGYRL